MLITRTSQLTGKSNTLEINISEEDLDRVNNRFHSGEMIQNIVPHLSGAEREFLMTGATSAEWEELIWFP